MFCVHFLVCKLLADISCMMDRFKAGLNGQERAFQPIRSIHVHDVVKLTARLLYGFGSKDRHWLLGNSDEKPPSLFQPHGERRRFDLDSALMYSDIKGHSGLYSRLSADLLGNDKSSGC